jgi:dihydroorotate dehydrogenase (NAD+) catalytic subunit
MTSLPKWLPFDPSGPVTIGPRTLPGRIWTASGCFGYGLKGHDILPSDGAMVLDGLGAVVTKTVTPNPRAGNPPPRIWDTGPGALNSIGLENVGLDVFLEDVVPNLHRQGIPFVVSLAGTRPQEFGDMTKRLRAVAADMPEWHGVELNLSCPNVAEGGVDFGRDPDMVRGCTEAAASWIGDRLLLAKLTPNSARIAPLAAAAAKGGAHGVTAINTLVGMDIDLRTGKPVLPRRRGGYSGPAILPVALSKVDEIVQETGLPVIGVGGIRCLDDALKFFAVGAVAVQIGTAQMDDPMTACRVVRDLGPTTDQ